ncbi:gluconokinase [Xylophilus ampelinus]|uniref:Gluconokinase n=1 Tax=Xylophilus ampelinus TaxID=54067 RepID=A0A318SQI9_9BURK|nr:gluconokinase [Xylophilus ampelinus]MCS4508740.1 gluconokinase [Xylophilus ampelinus]PYE79310.1 gluconokinase [Xylophilus ampelinus]
MDRPGLHSRLQALVFMGVSGCGKSSAGQACADALGWPMLEGDSYHSLTSVAKMRDGIALTDDDRSGWLDRLAGLLAEVTAPDSAAASTGVVLTCSALRKRYRDRLRQAQPQLGFVFLQLDYDQALARVGSRASHFFSPALVADQFATLEPPTGELHVLTLDATAPIGNLVARTVAWLGDLR